MGDYDIGAVSVSSYENQITTYEVETSLNAKPLLGQL